MNKISVLYSPKIDDEEMKIIKDVFKQDIDFIKLEQKGVLGGAFDINIIIDILNSPYLKACITAGTAIKLLYPLMKKVFNRNRKKIMDSGTRPKYTIITIRMKTKWIVVSNANKENKIMITKTSASSGELVKTEYEYTEDKLAEYIN